MSGIIAFFRASPPKTGAAFDEHRFRRVRWQTFIAMTLAYVTFYVCRLSFTVAKSALVELGITPTELGMIGSTLFFSYAIGKLVNGFIADHANVVRYMSLGLLLSAGMNLMMGMTTNGGRGPAAGHLLGDQRLGAVDGRRPLRGLAGALVRR